MMESAYRIRIVGKQIELEDLKNMNRHTHFRWEQYENFRWQVMLVESSTDRPNIDLIVPHLLSVTIDQQNTRSRY